jgi:hypothetical protein
MTQMTRVVVLACGLGLAASQAALAQEDLLGRWFLNVNAGLQAPGRDLPEVGTFSLYEENLTISGTRAVGSGVVIDVGAGTHLGESFAVGIAYSRFTKKTDVGVTASVPHPLFADRPRSAAASLNDLKRSEHVIHLTAMWRTLLMEGVDFKVGAGPSFFRVSETGPTQVTATEAGAPFENVTLAFGNGTRKKNGVGFHVVGDVTYMINERLGAGILLRYSAASIKLPMPGGSTRDDNGAGGLQFGGGLRLRF